MSHALFRAFALAGFVAIAASPALAFGDLPTETIGGGGSATQAPEIDAGSGLASVAVVLAGLALAWERRRRG
jgi:hypothetical protein